MLKLAGELDRAEADLDVAAALAPENPRVHYLRGLLWEERGQPLLAARAYEVALSIGSSYEEARFRVAGLWAPWATGSRRSTTTASSPGPAPSGCRYACQLVQALERQGRVGGRRAGAARARKAAAGQRPGGPPARRARTSGRGAPEARPEAARGGWSRAPAPDAAAEARPAGRRTAQALGRLRRERAAAYTAPALKTANLAIVFTDIKGFTERTSRQTLEENQRLLRCTTSSCRPLLQRPSAGASSSPSAMPSSVTFESPTQAVLSGPSGSQDRLGSTTAPRPETPAARRAAWPSTWARCGVESNDVFGEPVNIAARVEAIAEAGEVYFTEAVYLVHEQGRGALAGGGRLRAQGHPREDPRLPRAPGRPTAWRRSRGAECPAPASIPNERPPFGNLAWHASRASCPGSRSRAELGQRAVAAGDPGARVRRVPGHRRAHSVQRFPQRCRPAAARSPARRRAGSRVAWTVGLAGAWCCCAVVGFVRCAPARRAPPSRPWRGGRRAPRRAPARREGPSSSSRGDEAPRTDARLAARAAGRGAGDTRRRGDHYRTGGEGRRTPRPEDRLIEMLEHPECGVRARPPMPSAELKLTSARGELEDSGRGRTGRSEGGSDAAWAPWRLRLAAGGAGRAEAPGDDSGTLGIREAGTMGPR